MCSFTVLHSMREEKVRLFSSQAFYMISSLSYTEPRGSPRYGLGIDVSDSPKQFHGKGIFTTQMNLMGKHMTQNSFDRDKLSLVSSRGFLHCFHDLTFSLTIESESGMEWERVSRNHL